MAEALVESQDETLLKDGRRDTWRKQGEMKVKALLIALVDT